MAQIDLSKLSSEVKEKYQVRDNTFFATPKDDPKDRIQVELGDSKDPTNFQPQVKIMRWDNEVNCSIRLKDFSDYTVATEGEKIKLTNHTKKVNLYDLTEGEGGYEFEVILKEKPLTNKIEFTLQDKDVEYFYQPALTQQEIDRGASRPDDSVGSYAVYAKTPKTNYTDGKEYKCGKVGHIFRPKIIDSVGTEVWGELHIENGILSVTTPQEFLDKAVYPVKHAAGLTFGYTTLGISGQYGLNDALQGMLATGAAGIGESITFGAKRSGASDGYRNTKANVYVDSNEAQLTNGQTSEVYTAYSGTATWKTLNFVSAPTFTAINYVLTLKADGPALAAVASDAGGTNTSHYRALDYDTGWPNPAGFGAPGTAKFSIYATYTPGGGVDHKPDFFNFFV